MRRRTLAQILVFGLALGGCGAATAPAKAQAGPPVIEVPPAWTTYTAGEKDFTALFPGTPKAGTAAMGGVAGGQLRTYLLEAGPEAFTVVVFAYPKGALAQPMLPKDLADRARLFGEGAGWKLRSSTAAMVAGKPGLEAVFDEPETGAVIVFRMAQQGDRLYAITFGGPKGSEGTPQAQRFVGSLRLLSR